MIPSHYFEVVSDYNDLNEKVNQDQHTVYRESATVAADEVRGGKAVCGLHFKV